MGLAENIKSLRQARLWNQSELAAAVGTDQSTISTWERGVHRPDPESIAKLCKVFAVTEEMLCVSERRSVEATLRNAALALKECLAVVGELEAAYQSLGEADRLDLPPPEEAAKAHIQAVNDQTGQSIGSPSRPAGHRKRAKRKQA